MSTTPDTPVHAEDEEAYDADYLEDEQAPVSRRPRRRLLTPLTAGLFAVLLGAGGFIVGVQVEKGEVPASSGAGAVGGRLAAVTSGAGRATASGFGGGGSGASGGASGASATVGQVAYVSGHDLYVSTLQGNTVKVVASAAQITKSVSTSVKGVHPGDTVIVTGATGSDGAVKAASIRDSGSSGGDGLGALFGGRSGGGSSAGATTGATGRGGGAGGEQALFGR